MSTRPFPKAVLPETRTVVSLHDRLARIAAVRSFDAALSVAAAKETAAPSRLEGPSRPEENAVHLRPVAAGPEHAHDHVASQGIDQPAAGPVGGHVLGVQYGVGCSVDYRDALRRGRRAPIRHIESYAVGGAIRHVQVKLELGLADHGRGKAARRRHPFESPVRLRATRIGIPSV